MSNEKPELTTVTAKGQVTIPSSLRERFDLDEGDRLMAVPTEYGIVLKKIDLPTVEEFEERVEARSGETDLSLDDITELVHEKRGVTE